MKTIEFIGRRNYIVEEGKKLKMIPIDYTEIKLDTLISFIDFDSKKKTLSNKDRFNIEYFLWEEDLKRTEKYVYELIIGAKPIKAVYVNVNLDSDRTQLEYDNGVKLRVPRKMYDLFEPKDTIFSNF